MQNISITGANRGLGLEFTHQYLEHGERVFACCRNPEGADRLRRLIIAYPERLTILKMEVA